MLQRDPKNSERQKLRDWSPVLFLKCAVASHNICTKSFLSCWRPISQWFTHAHSHLTSLCFLLFFYPVKEVGFSARMDRNRFVKHVDDKRQGSGPNRSASASLGNIAVRRLISAEDPWQTCAYTTSQKDAKWANNSKQGGPENPWWFFCSLLISRYIASYFQAYPQYIPITRGFWTPARLPSTLL